MRFVEKVIKKERKLVSINPVVESVTDIFRNYPYEDIVYHPWLYVVVCGIKTTITTEGPLRTEQEAQHWITMMTELLVHGAVTKFQEEKK